MPTPDATPMTTWQTTRFRIDLGTPRVMGIVNVTPDSFSDAGQHADVKSALAHCERLLREGADLLDIGGESTRPGARRPSVGEELARVLPVLRDAVRLGVPISVDTSTPAVIDAALALGVDIVNDVRALSNVEAMDLVAGHGSVGVCLMHMAGEPATMQGRAQYDDVLQTVAAFLRERRQALCDRGVHADRIVLDPGIGFGKSVEHNLALLRRQRELLTLGSPLLVGWSRKSTLGSITGRPVHERLAASVAAALIAVQRGARIVRVHDVAQTVDALALWRALEPNNKKEDNR